MRRSFSNRKQPEPEAMAIDLKNQFRKKYPELFDQLILPFSYSFSVGDGWLKLLNKLCLQLMQDIQETGEDCKVIQVKEKFAELRIYCQPRYRNQHRWNLINEAREQSAVTCDVCGAAGQLVSSPGWLRTRCMEHPDIPPDY